MYETCFYIPNFIWKLRFYNFEYEGGVLQYDVGCLFDDFAKEDIIRNSMLEDGDAFSTAIASRSNSTTQLGMFTKILQCNISKVKSYMG